jgi:hypothetical protein
MIISVYCEVRVRASRATMMLTFHLSNKDLQMVSFQYSKNQIRVLYSEKKKFCTRFYLIEGSGKN